MGGGGSVPVPVAGRPPQPGIPWFLTIGDSITDGFTRDASLAGTNISWALRVERLLAAQGRPWRLFDTACPGETTLTYAARCPGRRSVPLLAHRSQRTAALAAIAADGGGLRLIVVALGSNDLLHNLTGDPATIQADLVTHLEAILTELRSAAPGVPIVVAGIYDPFAVGAPGTDAVLSPIDDAVAALAARLGDGFADFHAAVNHPADGAPLCSLIDCADLDIHPTALGQQRLAAAVMRAIPPPA
jgi:lysophospholipase L1-like esterase